MKRTRSMSLKPPMLLQVQLSSLEKDVSKTFIPHITPNRFETRETVDSQQKIYFNDGRVIDNGVDSLNRQGRRPDEGQLVHFDAKKTQRDWVG